MRTLKTSLCSVLMLLSTAGLTQSPPSRPPGGMGPMTQAAQGEVQSFRASTLTVINTDGSTSSFELPANVPVQIVHNKTLADIKQGDFVGSAAVLAADGKRYAEEVHFIPEAMRSQAEGHRAMGNDENRTMTNATVAQVARDPQGESLTLKYPGGEKTIIVKPGTPITALENGDASLLKPGVKVTVMSGRDEAGKSVVRVVRITP